MPNLEHLNSIYAVTMYHSHSKTLSSPRRIAANDSPNPRWIPHFDSTLIAVASSNVSNEKNNYIDCPHKTLKIRWRERMKCMKPYMPDFPVQIPVKINAKSWKYSRRKIDSNLEASVCLQPVTLFPYHAQTKVNWWNVSEPVPPSTSSESWLMYL